jgi:hypothetical protein
MVVKCFFYANEHPHKLTGIKVDFSTEKPAVSPTLPSIKVRPWLATGNSWLMNIKQFSFIALLVIHLYDIIRLTFWMAHRRRKCF